MISLDGGVTPLSTDRGGGAVARPGSRRRRAEDADDGAPWHDPAMPLPDRMKLAEGKPLPRRMMAAMAQQDCGQCGYNCKDYAEALFSKKEERLNLCVPGGKETARMLKSSMPSSARRAAGAGRSRRLHLSSRAPGRSRDNPVDATFVSRTPLNKARLGQGNLARRIRSRRERARLRRRRFVRHLSRQRSRRWSTR